MSERIDTFLKLAQTEGIDIKPDFLNWLMEEGFFTAPASTKFHGNYEGGLFDHSLAMTKELISLTNALNIKWKRKESPFIVGMFHDICKIDLYSVDVMGEYIHNDTVLKGHGDKSVMLLSQFMQLTKEEILCIRFHMGAYQTEDWNAYGKAIKEFETVLWSHTADMYASKVVGI